MRSLRWLSSRDWGFGIAEALIAEVLVAPDHLPRMVRKARSSHTNLEARLAPGFFVGMHGHGWVRALLLIDA